jgi:hypothetical protein
MDVEGKWWMLFEDEFLDMDRSRLYELRDGAVWDGRSGAAIGSFETDAGRTRITLRDCPGDDTIFAMRVGSQTNPADACAVDWTTSGFEQYRTSWPIPDDETEAHAEEREDWENEHFGQRVTYGAALRDQASIRDVHEQNVRNPDGVAA